MMIKNNMGYKNMTVRELRDLVNSIPAEDDNLEVVGFHEWDGGGCSSDYLKFDKYVSFGGDKIFAITTFRKRRDYEETEYSQPWGEPFDEEN